MPSLLDAIEAKYGQDGRDCEHSEAPIGIRVPRVGPRKSIPRLLILNDCNVDSAGDENQLEKTCSGVLEIDLAHNRLTEWSEISKILQYSPAATFLNLSFNSLATPVSLMCQENSFEFPFLPRLNTLILINTSITWDTVWFLLKRATALQELHLSMNDFKTVDLTSSRRPPCCSKSEEACHDNNDAENENTVEQMSSSPSRSDEDSGNYSDSGIGSSSDDDDGICFPHLKRLMFDGNPINSWDEVAKLGMCFQSLRHLGLSDCPIAEITEDACQYFENLQSLWLSNTLIHDLEHVSRLNLLSSLTELRIQGIPLLHDMTAHERRQLLVALLKNVKKLNGGAPISSTERESAERAFIRHFAQSEQKPQRYFELLAIHGELAPLIDVQFKPTAIIKVRICCERFMEERQVSIYQTTHELKTTLEPILGITSSKMRLFYVDPALQGIFGREELRLPHKQLYSYNMQDGDEIHVEQKLKSSLSIPSTSTSGASRGGNGSPSPRTPSPTTPARTRTRHHSHAS